MQWHACILHEYYIFNFIDIDECVRFNNGGCEHDCHNSNGSFSCTCRAGYTLKKDHLSCAGMLSIACTCWVSKQAFFLVDDNECLTKNGGCTQACNNVAGSYYCSCLIGYELANDNHTCNGMVLTIECIYSWVMGATKINSRDKINQFFCNSKISS